MLTHSWILAHYLGQERFNPKLQDLYVYNICPDFLPIHGTFNSRMTHGISRFRPIPYEYSSANFIIFHLMVDDISHYGAINSVPESSFNPQAKGYSYLKGESLREPIMDFYRMHGEPIDISTASYQSHMIIEMTFDLALYWGAPEESGKLLTHMCDAVRRTIEEKMEEFSRTAGWFYDVHPEEIEAAMKKCYPLYNKTSMEEFMTLEGRVHAFFRKFCPALLNTGAKATLTSIMQNGIALVKDYRAFLPPTLKAIKDAGFSALP